VVTFAPSVGLSEPWRFVVVDAPERREAVRASFMEANADVLAGYWGERAQLYATLKLEGLADAPVQLAVFCDEQTDQGHGLGRHTMPEMLAYSVVAAIQLLWLSARAQGLGLGWVSILKPGQITQALQIPEAWRLVAYLCLGYPEEEHCEPALARAGWEYRRGLDHNVIQR
jgi:5,6-dimethylbenzimidazole synthase